MSELIEKNSLKYNKNQKYIIWDLETCNLNLRSLENKPFQLGYVLAEGPNIIETNNIYLKWDKLNVSADAARITRYDPQLVNDIGLSPKEVLEDFESYIYNPEYRILFFNGLNFDTYIHQTWRRNLGLPTDFSYLKRCIDVHALVKGVKLNFPMESNFLFWQYKLLKHRVRGMKSNLTQSCKDFGVDIDVTKTHDATYDVLLTYQLFLELIKRVDIK